MNLDGGVHQIPLDGVPGELWLCGKHAIAPDPSALFARFDRHASLIRVVCLVEPHELAGRYDAYLDWLKSNSGVDWFPIQDLTSPSVDVVWPLYQRTWQAIEAGEVVVAHCAAGIGRAGTLAVAMCMLNGMSLDDAQSHVRRHRPGAGPEVGGQSAMLDELSTRLAV